MSAEGEAADQKTKSNGIITNRAAACGPAYGFDACL